MPTDTKSMHKRLLLFSPFSLPPFPRATSVVLLLLASWTPWQAQTDKKGLCPPHCQPPPPAAHPALPSHAISHLLPPLQDLHTSHRLVQLPPAFPPCYSKFYSRNRSYFKLTTWTWHPLWYLAGYLAPTGGQDAAQGHGHGLWRPPGARALNHSACTACAACAACTAGRGAAYAARGALAGGRDLGLLAVFLPIIHAALRA